jgi:rhamnosyltransferase
MKVNLFIPTLNAGHLWKAVIEAIEQQTYRLSKVIIIDSGSTDQTLSLIEGKGYELMNLDKKDFDHGGTRMLAAEKYQDADIFIFLTQDAILANSQAIENMVMAFEAHPKYGMVYGRQLPHTGSKTLEAHARLFNYPDLTRTKSLADAPKLGIKTISCSNSFAAYRKEAFFEVGGFPSGVILGEDVLIAGKMLLNGWEMGYLGKSNVYHSHDYTVKEEFKRYFDIGVFHAGSPWIFENFGKAESEGLKYLKSEFSYVVKNNLKALPKSIATIFAKYIGYKIGLNNKRFSLSLNRSMSMHKAYWDRKIK